MIFLRLFFDRFLDHFFIAFSLILAPKMKCSKNVILGPISIQIQWNFNGVLIQPEISKWPEIAPVEVSRADFEATGGRICSSFILRKS